MSGRPSKGRCLFCGSRGKLTNEHVLSKPLVDLLPPSDEDRFVNVLRAGSHPIVQTRTIPTRDRRVLQVRAYCGPCNGGWMQQMDHDIVPVIAPMVRGEQTVLEREDCLRLAAWVAKMSLVHWSLAGDENPVPVAAYRRFFKFRRPSPDHYVALGRHSGPEGQDCGYTLGKSAMGPRIGAVGGASVWLGDAVFYSALFLNHNRQVRTFVDNTRFAVTIHPATAPKHWPPVDTVRVEEMQRFLFPPMTKEVILEALQADPIMREASSGVVRFRRTVMRGQYGPNLTGGIPLDKDSPRRR